MPDFSRRSLQPELMDLPITDREELFTNLREIERINGLTLGVRDGLRAVKRLAGSAGREVHVLDVGFGAGDFLAALARVGGSSGAGSGGWPAMRLSGVDRMAETVDYVRRRHPGLVDRARLHVEDVEAWFERHEPPDVVYAALFCHHLDGEQLVRFLALCRRARIGAVINDLVRSPVAYHAIRLATRVASRSRFTRHDAPLSVLRGFRAGELREALDAAGVRRYRIRRTVSYRYLLTIQSEEAEA